MALSYSELQHANDVAALALAPLRIPEEVARESAMMSPSIPI
jgi:hypothetical protein